MKYFFKRIMFAVLITAGFYVFHLYQDGKFPSFVYGSGDSYKHAHVVRAVDGDTLEVKLPDGQTTSIRLIGIDTPESVRPGVPVECGSHRASKHMTKIAAGKTVTVKTDPTQGTKDRYGRMLAYIVLPNGQTVQENQLRAGLAELYVYEGKNFQMKGTFEKDQKQAKASASGTWGPPCNGDFHSAS